MEERVLENVLIISIGVYAHVNNLTIIGYLESRPSMLLANGSSTLVTLSLLALLTTYCPTWLSPLSEFRQKFFAFVVRLMLILYTTEMVLRKIWVPILQMLNFKLNTIGMQLVNTDDDGRYCRQMAQGMSDWVRNDLFYGIRFFISVGVLLFMMFATGLISTLKTEVPEVLRSIYAMTCEYIMQHAERFTNQMNSPPPNAFRSTQEEVCRRMQRPRRHSRRTRRGDRTRPIDELLRNFTSSVNDNEIYC